MVSVAEQPENWVVGRNGSVCVCVFGTRIYTRDDSAADALACSS